MIPKVELYFENLLSVKHAYDLLDISTQKGQRCYESTIPSDLPDSLDADMLILVTSELTTESWIA